MCFGMLGSEVGLRYQEQNHEGGKAEADNIQQVEPGYYIWYQSRGWLVLRWGIVISHIGSKRPELGLYE